jgi:3-oxoacyl-[acyl-carrier protein] reductase
MIINLLGKNAIVCGSTSGIGKAIAQEFVRSGANVTLVARNEKLLKQTLKELSEPEWRMVIPLVKEGKVQKQKLGFLAADFDKPEQLKRKISNFVKKNLPVHILVNNSGGPQSGDIIKAKTSEFLIAFKRHLMCNHILVSALWEGMKKAKYGRIINVISTSVKEPIPGLGVSNTIRAAVASWAKTLSLELAPFGITVNNILPGATTTPRLLSLFGQRAKAAGKSFEDIEKEWLTKIPAGRFASPEEIAFAAAFLASPAAGYINGINLPVDGGRLSSL